jgi:hypothetical protein
MVAVVFMATFEVLKYFRHSPNAVNPTC